MSDSDHGPTYRVFSAGRDFMQQQVQDRGDRCLIQFHKSNPMLGVTVPHAGKLDQQTTEGIILGVFSG